MLKKFLDEIIQPTGYFKKYKSYSEILELKKYLAMQGVVGIFIKAVQFERLGAFIYSREEGTPAYGFKGQIARKV